MVPLVGFPTRLARRTLAALAVVALAGCIAIPVPLSEKKVLQGTPVSAEQIAFLQAGATTRAEAFERLGAPQFEWEDARVSIYQWDMRQGVLLWAVGAYSTGGVGVEDIPRHHLLLLEFDAAGRLVRHEKAVRPLLKSLPEFLLVWRGTRGLAPVDAPAKTMVLLRIACTIDGEPCEPFGMAKGWGHPLVSLGLGDFGSAGEPREAKPEFLSRESEREGWAYLMLHPGTYYLSLFGPEASSSRGMGQLAKRGARWRLVVPGSTVPVYAGSLRAVGKVDGKLMLGDPIINPVDPGEVEIVYENERAAEVLAAHASGAVPVPVKLESWRPGDTVILSSPPPAAPRD